MKEQGITKFEDNRISITYVAPTERVTFDSTAFKKDQPELYKQYSKSSMTKESVRIKLKESKDE